MPRADFAVLCLFCLFVMSFLSQCFIPLTLSGPYLLHLLLLVLCMTGLYWFLIRVTFCSQIK